MHLCRSSSNVPCLPSFLEMLQNPHVLVTFDTLHNPLRLPRETTSEPPKLVRTWCALYILPWKCASRHNGVHFLDISASKSGPTMVCFVHFDLEMCFAPQLRALVQHLNFQKWSERGVLCTFWLLNVLRATAACTFSTSQLPKVVRTWCALYILTWKCASRHNGVHFLDISTSKRDPHLVCFVHFDLEMCFAPQRRALVQHLNFQKWSERGVLCTFWLLNVLRATAACTFSTSQLPKVARTWCALYSLTWKCASRHNGVQFFISHLASWLRTRRFSEPTFRPSGATNHWKNTLFRDFPSFSRACIFFLLTLSLLLFSLLIFLFSLTLSISAFHLSILSEVWLLNFLRSRFTPYWAAFIWLSWQPDLRISSLSCLPQDWTIFGVGRRANPAAFTAVFVIFCVIGTIIRKCRNHMHMTRWKGGHRDITIPRHEDAIRRLASAMLWKKKQVIALQAPDSHTSWKSESETRERDQQMHFSSYMRFHSGSIQPEWQNASSNIWRCYHLYVECG